MAQPHPAKRDRATGGHMGLIYLTRPATPEELRTMSEAHDSRIKFAVDVERSVAVGGGELHADCEAALLEDGSSQEHIWGAHINLKTGDIMCESMINLRPSHDNPSLEVQDKSTRDRIECLIRYLLGRDPHA
jgi:hypothetical protein